MAEFDAKVWKDLTGSLGETLKKLADYSDSVGKPKFAELFRGTLADLDDDLYLIDPKLGHLEW